MDKLELTTRLNDRGNNKFKEQQLVEFLNQVLFIAATDEDLRFYIEDNTSITTTAVQTYAYPTNHRSGKTIFIKSGGVDGTDLDFEDFGTTFRLTVIPTTGTELTIRQFRKPTKLLKTDTAGTLPDFPEEFHDILLDRASAVVLRELREFQRAGEYEAKANKRTVRMVETINANFALDDVARDVSITLTQKSFDADGEWSPR